MCGFSGILNPSRQCYTTSRTIVDQMTDALAHRGPDASCLWAEGEIALGHRRLSILDLSDAGAQPMQSSCDRYVLAYNGEIYNHLDLRKELEASDANPDWKGHSDTETLLAGIAYWGLDETLLRTGGMFALALWDRQEKQLCLARDRIGEKPLFWGWAGNNLIFGSELKALRKHPECPAEICRHALAQYLNLAYVPAPLSILSNIYKLEPGCILQIDGTDLPTPPPEPVRPGQQHGALSIRRYWALKDTIEEGHRQQFSDDERALVALENTLTQAVSRQLISDVPIGAFLSGGIDSSLTVALMQKLHSNPVKTFTIGFENQAFNEAPYAAAIGRHLGTDHTELLVTEKETRDIIPQLQDIFDEPFADSSQIPTHLVCKMARRDVTVALSGDAADELFGGYNRYHFGPEVWKFTGNMPTFFRRGMGKLLSIPSVSFWNTVGKFPGGRFAFPHAGDKIQKLSAVLRHADTYDDIYRILISYWPEGIPLLHNDFTPFVTSLDNPLSDLPDWDRGARMMALDMQSYLPDDILCKVDRAAMATSLEVRAPFLDPEVIAMSMRLPGNMKIRNGQGKWALRQILFEYVDRELIERPKTGFSIPVGEWLRGPLRPWAEELLSQDALMADGLLDPAPIRKAWSEHLAGVCDWTGKLWIILNFQAWRAHWS